MESRPVRARVWPPVATLLMLFAASPLLTGQVGTVIGQQKVNSNHGGFLEPLGFVDQFDPHSVPNPALEKDLTPAQKKLLEQTREARRKMAASTDRRIIDPILKHLAQTHGLTEPQVNAVRDHCIKIMTAPKNNNAFGLEI